MRNNEEIKAGGVLLPPMIAIIIEMMCAVAVLILSKDFRFTSNFYWFIGAGSLVAAVSYGVKALYTQSRDHVVITLVFTIMTIMGFAIAFLSHQAAILGSS